MGALLIGLIACVATIVIIACVYMCKKWLVPYIQKRIQARKSHDVRTAFIDTKEVVDDYLKDKVNEADEISMTELENLTTNTPFVAVDIDRTSNELSQMEGMCPEEGTDTNFEAHMKQHQGILLFD